MAYKKAPLSEVIFGFTYKSRMFSDDELFLMNNLFSEEFPIVEIVAPLIIEDLRNFQLFPIINPTLTGTILYRRRTSERNWLLQMQGNAIYLNWIRQDSAPVGNYIGYNAIFDKFLKIIEAIENLLHKSLKENIYLLDLTYQDRINWQSYKNDLNSVSDIMNIQTPPITSDSIYNNIFSKYTQKKDSLNGFGIVNINTATSMAGNQVFRIETIYRGHPLTSDIKTWFDTAHNEQTDFFTSLFKENVLDSWR